MSGKKNKMMKSTLQILYQKNNNEYGWFKIEDSVIRKESKMYKKLGKGEEFSKAYLSGEEYLDDFVMENYEVCGNKFDNPELLESEE